MPRQRKDFLLNPVVITLVVVIAVIAAFNFYQNMAKINHLENQIQKIEAEIAEAEAKNQKLKEQLENSDSHEYIEEVAREKLGLVKPGEKMFIPVEENEDEDEDSKQKK
ncbi:MULTISPECIES: FtsB family cell division protein [Halanaerobium]|jgi:cell division protein FtsB|uniref:Cell division protein FtsL n=1 Tax=Halanaerobium kushneri TaxID=56779 RepID=A0A1N7BWZ7_9FIRM|nr:MULTISPECIES: septum formation initiator family protein [Halanaerobium]RCW52698.1 cell division protein FtsL [Halanaerobium sp. ST460_2HS_T2]SIR55763.1 cell division protein FtsL [Halanaerobium kushneri]